MARKWLGSVWPSNISLLSGSIRRICFLLLYPRLLICTLKLHSGAALETGFGAAAAVPCGLNGRHAAHVALVRSRCISCIGSDAAAELEAGFGASKAVCPVINLHPPFNGLPPPAPAIVWVWNSSRQKAVGGSPSHEGFRVVGFTPIKMFFINLPPFINLRPVC